MPGFGKNALLRWAGEARHLAAAGASSLARLGGRHLLSRPQTDAYLRAHGVELRVGELSELKTTAFSKLEILRGGVVRAGGKECLDFDYGSRTALSGWLGPSTEVGQAAAVWSHYWMGYYHWIVDVLPKILLLKERTALSDLSICWPFSGEPYEEECLELLEIPPTCVFNTRNFSSIRADEIWCSPLPGWEIPSPAALKVRETLLPLGTGQAGPRIYVSRGGRRRCANEREVFALLSRYDFHFVEDRPRSLTEQIGIFREAECIVAPHGAALTNLLWCRPQTKVLELAAGEYQPAYYRNLSTLVGIDYQSLASPSRGKSHWTAMSNPIEVDLTALEAWLEQNFS